MENPIKARKAALRAQYLQLRGSLSKAQKSAYDAALCRAVAEHPYFQNADLLLTFCAVRGEVDLSPLLQIARQRGIKTAFPRCEGTQMLFHVVQTQSELSAGRFGIPTPCADAPVARPTASTLCLLPALAATRDGLRLGYGGGFYDRFLADFKGHTILPLYELLLAPSLPSEPTDMRAEVMLTEKGVLKFHA